MPKTKRRLKKYTRTKRSKFRNKKSKKAKRFSRKRMRGGTNCQEAIEKVKNSSEKIRKMEEYRKKNYTNIDMLEIDIDDDLYEDFSEYVKQYEKENKNPFGIQVNNVINSYIKEEENINKNLKKEERDICHTYESLLRTTARKPETTNYSVLEKTSARDRERKIAEQIANQNAREEGERKQTIYHVANRPVAKPPSYVNVNRSKPPSYVNVNRSKPPSYVNVNRYKPPSYVNMNRYKPPSYMNMNRYKPPSYVNMNRSSPKDKTPKPPSNKSHERKQIESNYGGIPSSIVPEKKSSSLRAKTTIPDTDLQHIYDFIEVVNLFKEDVKAYIKTKQEEVNPDLDFNGFIPDMEFLLKLNKKFKNDFKESYTDILKSNDIDIKKDLSINCPDDKIWHGNIGKCVDVDETYGPQKYEMDAVAYAAAHSSPRSSPPKRGSQSSSRRSP